MTALPAGWVTTTLGDVALEVRNGISSKPDQDAGLPILRISAVRPLKLDASDVRYLPADFRDADTYALRTDDLLFTRYNGNRELVGACARVHAVAGTLTYPDKLIRVRLDTRAAMPAFIEAAACAQGARNFIDQQLKTSAGQVGVSGADLKRLPLPLAPLAEQQRIADKLDAVVARVDACRDRLARVTPLLKRFRQSVLVAATSGKLTQEWREQSKSTSEFIDSSPTDLPTGWRHTTFAEVCGEITVGFVGKMANEYVDSGVPFLRSMNVREFRFDAKGLKFISPAFHRGIQKSALRSGDLAIVRSGAPGTCCVIPPELDGANCSDLVIARPGRDLVSGFGCILINSSFGASHVAATQVGVAQAHFNVGAMKLMPCPLPPVEEQAEIVRRVETLFAFADRLEARLAKAQAAADRLTPSLLAKAFRGELVPQDPADEPAAVLLQRLAASQPAPTAKTRRPRAGQAG